MAEMIDTGHYRVRSESLEDQKKNKSVSTEYGVIKGDVASNTEYGLFGRQFGFNASKWYAYKLEKTSIIPRLDFSPTAPTRAFKEHFGEIWFAQQEFDTKKDAVAFTNSEWD